MKNVSRQRRPLGITLIAIGKLIKVLLLVTAGVAALTLLHRSLPGQLVSWAGALRIDSRAHYLERALLAANEASSKELEEVGIGSLCYALLFAIEGLGLWFQRRWGEYFTITITGSFIPFEVYELVKRSSAPRFTTLLLNLVALSYLVVRVVRRRARRTESA